MSQKVVALKLSTGEEIIGRVENRTEQTITVDRPNIIGLVPSQGGIHIQLMPWFASNQTGSVEINAAHVVGETEPAGELEKGYLEKTSGISLVTG